MSAPEATSACSLSDFDCETIDELHPFPVDEPDNSFVFPPPPLPAAPGIEPIETPAQLKQEASEMKHCALSLQSEVQKGTWYFYKGTSFDRCTIALVGDPESGWWPSEIAGFQNRPVSVETRETVFRWVVSTQSVLMIDLIEASFREIGTRPAEKPSKKSDSPVSRPPILDLEASRNFEKQGLIEEAEKKLFDLYETETDPECMDTECSLGTLLILADFYKRNGRPHEAEALFCQVLAGERSLQHVCPENILYSLAVYHGFLRDQGRVGEAESLKSRILSHLTRFRNSPANFHDVMTKRLFPT